MTGLKLIYTMKLKKPCDFVPLWPTESPDHRITIHIEFFVS